MIKVKVSQMFVTGPFSHVLNPVSCSNFDSMHGDRVATTMARMEFIWCKSMSINKIGAATGGAVGVPYRAKKGGFRCDVGRSH